MAIQKDVSNGKEETVILALGSNIGDRYEHILQSIKLLASTDGIQLLACSSVYETDALDFEGDKFYNLTVAISCVHDPLHLLAVTQQIEIDFGRPQNLRGIRNKEYQARKIDIDILYYGNIVVNNDRLIIPHPLINNRLFVIKPLLDMNLLLPSSCIIEQETIDALWINQKVHTLNGVTGRLKTALKGMQLLK